MHRRSFLFGAGASLIAAPAIVRAASLMPVSSAWVRRSGTRVFLDAMHRVANPVMLMADDGIVDFSTLPGALNVAYLPPGKLLVLHF